MSKRTVRFLAGILFVPFLLGLVGCAEVLLTPNPDPIEPVVEAALQHLRTTRIQYQDEPRVIRVDIVERPRHGGDAYPASLIKAWQVTLEGNFWMDASFAGMDETNSAGLGCVTVTLSTEDLSMLSVESVGGACQP